VCSTKAPLVQGRFPTNALASLVRLPVAEEVGGSNAPHIFVLVRNRHG
jgi:hypothetical protein